MLRIEEIVGAMDDEFRYALDALSDERLAALAADQSALRRLRPVGVSHAEALEMIAAIQAARAERQRREDLAARRKARRKAAPRRRKETPPPGPAARPAASASLRLAAPPEPLRLTMPDSSGPAIRLPPPPTEQPAIALPPPTAAFDAPPPRRLRRVLAVALAVAVLAAVVVAAL